MAGMITVSYPVTGQHGSRAARLGFPDFANSLHCSGHGLGLNAFHAIQVVAITWSLELGCDFS